MHFFVLTLTVFLVRVHFFYSFFYYFSDFKSVKKVYPYEENALVLLILTVFLVRVHFFFTLFYYFSDFKSVKKVYPYEENALFLLILTVFLVRVHFFYCFLLFFRFQKCKKSVPLRGKCIFFTNFDCFPRKGTLFLLFFIIFQISKV